MPNTTKSMIDSTAHQFACWHTRQPNRASVSILLSVAALVTLLTPSTTSADPGSRLLATSGAMQIEGSAGGGIVPWAVIAGYGSDTEVGGAGFYTAVNVDDFSLWSTGAAVGINNRFEFSVARQHLNVLPLGLDIEQDIVGVKARITGDLIYGDLPQIAVGAQFKRNKDMAVPTLLGAADASGTDYYASAAKLWLGAAGGYNVFTNVTVRHTEANQGGLLGFGSAGEDTGDWQIEGSAAVFLDYNWAVGVDYRQKPDQLGLGEKDWADAFIAWFPNKRVAVVAAWAQLGSIAGLEDQSGWYLSMQVTQ